MTLRWEEQKTGGFYAYSGDLVVGLVTEVGAGPHAGRWVYDLHGVAHRWTCKGRGYVKTAAMAKRSMTKAWNTWLARAGLNPVISKRKT